MKKTLSIIKYVIILFIISLLIVIFTNKVLNMSSDDGIIYYILISLLTLLVNYFIQNIKFNQTINSVYVNGEEVYREENGETIIDKRNE